MIFKRLKKIQLTEKTQQDTQVHTTYITCQVAKSALYLHYSYEYLMCMNNSNIRNSAIDTLIFIH